MKSGQTPGSAFQPGRHLQILDDPSHDPYQDREKLAEPSVCADCGAVFHEGRWQWAAVPAHAHKAHCTACRRIHDKFPAGYVSIEGSFAQAHKAELINLARHLESREKADHPLQRIMAIEEQDGHMMITTTDIHLARTIGEALHRAYKGELDYQYNKEEYLLRVRWKH
ncbi:MAG TPA: BCAM0308 family protein [Noviherbaspirillum sp.]|uniref:BCAM0308 family protein n=1 Tax=Noviherbaspirillum sp. TaxID=1926288 RepID=UPI002B4917AE|nr:BCAM0308 family protein [Noviherbaspirillum sp.]HJV84383.1 BCAM0308 family protein [Noviherbaspirillum sp.]